MDPVLVVTPALGMPIMLPAESYDGVARGVPVVLLTLVISFTLLATRV